MTRRAKEWPPKDLPQLQEEPRSIRVLCMLLGVVGLVVAAWCIWAAFDSVLGAEQLVGSASVVDGDTIEINSERVRFDGIDAPESGQSCARGGNAWRCGQVAANTLDTFLAAARPTRCQLTGDRSYDRWIGTCFRADGSNVSEWLVREGWALPAPRYALGRFQEEQAEARAAERGLWAGDFVPPWEWRRGERLGGTSAEDRECPIKGNVSRDGERIYHSPGQQHYSRTKIDENEGERWFCSAAQAEAAGWRPAMR